MRQQSLTIDRPTPAQSWVAVSGLLGALFSLALPASILQSSEIPVVLAVGALALLAGHSWGLLVVALADALLIGGLWPVIAFPDAHTSGQVVLTTGALLATVPGLLQLGRALPRTVELVVGSRASHRLRSAGVACSAAFIAVWIALPIL